MPPVSKNQANADLKKKKVQFFKSPLEAVTNSQWVTVGARFVLQNNISVFTSQV